MRSVFAIRGVVVIGLLAVTAAACQPANKPTARARGDNGGGGGKSGADAAADVPQAPVGNGNDSTPKKDAAATDLPVPPASTPAPPPWTVEDIGEVGMKGEARYARDRFRLLAAGDDIGGKKDAFGFGYYKVSGDFEAVTRVMNVDYSHPMAKGGVMIRASNDPAAPNVMLAVTGGGAGLLQYRATAGGDTTINDADKLNIKTDTFLKLVRVGNSFTAYRSPDRAAGSWVKIDATEVTMPAEVLVGLAATSHDKTSRGQAEFDQFRISNLAEPWFHEDLGLVSGLVQIDKGAMKMAVVGDAWSTTQEFGTYAYQMIEGDFVLTARAVSLDKTADAARLALIARNASNASWSRSHSHAAVSVTPEMGGRFQFRNANGGNTMPTEMNLMVKAPVWLRLERVGADFTGSWSADGKTWTALGTANMPSPGIGAKIAVGLMMTSGSPKMGGTGVFDSITLQGAGAAPIPDAGAPPDAGPPDAPAPDAAVDTRGVDTRPDTRGMDTRADTRADTRR